MNRRKLPKLAAPLPANPELNRLLEQGARHPNIDQDRLALLHALQEAKLLIPILEPPGRAGKASDGQAHNLKMAVLEMQGGLALAGFTDVPAYRRYTPTQNLTCVSIAATDLCRFAVQGQFRALVLNPGGPYGYEMTPTEFQMVAERLLPTADGGMTVATDTRAQIGMPAQRPGQEFLQAVTEIAQTAGASELHWFWLSIAGGVGHLAFAVQPADPALLQTIGNAIAPLWKEERPDNPLLDILPFSSHLVGEQVVAAIQQTGERLLPASSAAQDK